LSRSFFAEFVDAFQHQPCSKPSATWLFRSFKRLVLFLPGSELLLDPPGTLAPGRHDGDRFHLDVSSQFVVPKSCVAKDHQTFYSPNGIWCFGLLSRSYSTGRLAPTVTPLLLIHGGGAPLCWPPLWPRSSSSLGTGVCVSVSGCWATLPGGS